MYYILPSDVKPDPKFVLLPFINKKLSSKAKTFFHNLKIKVSFTTNNNLYTKLRPRESSIKGKFSEANVIYKFKCSSYERDYIGYTERPSNVRISEHSQRGSHLNKAHFSLNEYRVPVSPDVFTIIARGKFRRDLQIKEAYFISLLKPKINVKYEKN